MSPLQTDAHPLSPPRTSGTPPSTRVAILLDASAPHLLEKDEWAASAARLRGLAAQLDVAGGHSLNHLYELRHGPAAAVDFSVSAELSALEIAPSVVLPDWWPRLSRVLYGPPPGGGEPVFRSSPWLEFDEKGDSLILGGVFLAHGSDTPDWARTAQDLSILDPAYARIATSRVLQELASDLGHSWVGLMCGREGPDGRHLKVVGEVEHPEGLVAFRDRWVTRTQDPSSLAFLECLRRCRADVGDPMRILASFDVDLGRDEVSRRLGFEISASPVEPSMVRQVVDSIPDLIPESGDRSTAELVARLKAHCEEWPEDGLEMANGERCWMGLNHLKVTHQPSAPTELKFYFRADTRSLVAAFEEAGVEASGLPRHASVEVSGEPVYVLGTLEPDFGTVAREDAFARRMAGPAGTHHDPVRMADHLGSRPSDADELLWLLCIDGAPVYALRPARAFATDIYRTLVDLFRGQVEGAVERVGLPGLSTAQSARTRDGEVVPLLELPDVRGVYGWRMDELVESALSAVGAEGEDLPAIRRELRSFLARVQEDMRNRGRTSGDRALNFAATNAYQAALVLTESARDGFVLDSIEVVPSPSGRPGSDCWDVVLAFLDPESTRRSGRTYRYTVDVGDVLPITVGEVRSWRSAGG